MSDAKQEVVKQLTKNGRTITGVHDLLLRDGSGAVGTLTAFTGGVLSADRLEIVTATGPFGPECVVIPFDGHSVLPGEYHLTLPGALRSPVEFLRRRGGTWNAGADDEMAGWLKSQKLPTYRLPDELRQGLTKVKLESLFQLFPVGPQHSALVFTVGGIHTMIELEPYLDLASKLGAAIAQARAPGALAPLSEIRFGPLVAAAHAGQLDEDPEAAPANSEPSPGAPVADATESLRAALAPFVGKRVLLAPISDKTLDNITKKVAKGAEGADIVAFLDSGVRASGKAGLAFTADAVHISVIGENWSIAYGDILTFSLRRAKLTIDSRLTGEITFDVYGVEDEVIPALEAATGRSSG